MSTNQHNALMFGRAEAGIGLQVLNGAAATASAGKPIIFDSVNSTGQIVAKMEDWGATCSGGNTFAKDPSHKVLGFPEVTFTASALGVIIYSGYINIRSIGTITGGGMMKWAGTGGMTPAAGMGAATNSDTGKIRGFWMQSNTGVKTSAALVLPWMI